MGRLVGRIWVGFTTCLIAFIAYSSQIFVIWPWYGRVLSVELLILLLPFNVLVGLLYWNYYLCTVTDPGGVPNTYYPELGSNDGYEVKRLTGSPRYCRTCAKYKPPRAHHCRQCKRCVLRMDHHCPWVNNCVGHYNYGHFIRFLFFVDVACSYHLAMVTARTFAAMRSDYWDGPDTTEFVFLILNYTACVPVILTVGAFSMYHFYCLSTNTTTIEGWEKDKVATLVRRGKIHEVKFPYNIGVRANIECVLGPQPLLWLWPSVPNSNGLKFKVADGDDDAQMHWPPQDPASHRYGPHIDDADDDDETEDQQGTGFELPSSPWTYETGSLNPDLEPSNARQRATRQQLRSRHKSKHNRVNHGAIANVPPYHPDYVEPSQISKSAFGFADFGNEDEYESGSDSDTRNYSGHRVRRGSEGFEIKPVNREAILRQYIASRGEEVGRYQRYVPEPASDSESSEDKEEFDPDVDGLVADAS